MVGHANIIYEIFVHVSLLILYGSLTEDCTFETRNSNVSQSTYHLVGCLGKVLTLSVEARVNLFPTVYYIIKCV